MGWGECRVGGGCWGRPAPSYMVGREDKRTNNRTMFPALKNNAAAGYKGPVKVTPLIGVCLQGCCGWPDLTSEREVHP